MSPSIQSKLANIERDLISSHQKEKLYEESLAVAKMKSDPNYFSDMQRKLVCVLVILVLFMIQRETY